MEDNLEIKNIENIIQIQYLQNLIKACEKQNIDKENLEKELEKISNDSKASQKAEKIKNSNNHSDSPTSQQFSEDYLYLKPWTKLNPIHKIIKIKEFVNQLNTKNEEDKQELKDKLITMVKNKLLTKKDSVLYDASKGKIISIPDLEFKNGKYNIEKSI